MDSEIRASVPFRIVLAIVFLYLPLQSGCGGSAPVFDENSAFRFLEEQCEIGPRFPGSREHKLLQRYIVDQLREFEINVSLQPFEGVLTTGDTLDLVNIIGNCNMKASRRIMLGAHYDTRPYADRDPDTTMRNNPIVGANDGASGVAVLLEIARLLGTTEPPIGVDFVFFDGEDYGREGVPQDYILGSSYFVRHLKGYRPSAVIVVDMVGERGAEIKVEGFSGAASAGLVEEVYAAAERLGVESFRREEGAAIVDDHLPFIQAGIPAIVLIDFEYPHWHTLEDTPDKCSPQSLGEVGRVLIEYIWSQK
jgi:hypothetical protein